MTRHPPFPDLDPWKDRPEIERRFQNGQFSPLRGALNGDIIRRCWVGEYKSVDEIVRDLRGLARLKLYSIVRRLRHDR
jgi:hypothetical protein